MIMSVGSDHAAVDRGDCIRLGVPARVGLPRALAEEKDAVANREV